MTKEEPNPLTLGSTFLAPVLGCTATMLIVLWAAAGLDDWLWSAAMFLSLGISGSRRHLNILRSTLIVGISVAHIAVAGYFVLPGDMLLPVATFLAGQSEDNIDRSVGLVLAAMPGLTMAARVAWTGGNGWMIITALSVCLVQYAGWMLGRWKIGKELAQREAEHHTRLAQQDNVKHAQLAAMDEREHITREMHDVLAHSLTAIMVEAQGGRMVAADDDARLIFSTIAKTAKESISDIRSLLDNIDDQPLHPEPDLDDIGTLMERFRREGLQVAYARDDNLGIVPPGLGLSMYRVVEECLTNALRHGEPRRALVVLRTSHGVITLTVENPVAQNSAVTPDHRGRGLSAIRQRCRQYGGDATFQCEQGRFTVRAWWKLQDMKQLEPRNINTRNGN